MFLLLRALAVIGIVFMFSPVREGATRLHQAKDEGTTALPAIAPVQDPHDPDTWIRIARIWGALPGSVWNGLLAGLASGPERGLESGSPARPPSHDTLTTADRRPAWRGRLTEASPRT